MELQACFGRLLIFHYKQFLSIRHPRQKKKKKRDLVCHKASLPKQETNKGVSASSHLIYKHDVESPTLQHLVQLRPTPICANVPRVKSRWSYLLIMKQSSSVRKCLTPQFIQMKHCRASSCTLSHGYPLWDEEALVISSRSTCIK